MKNVILFHKSGRIKTLYDGTTMLEYAPNGGDSRTEHYTYYGVEEVVIPPGGSVLAVIAGMKLQHFLWRKSQFNEVKTENQCYQIINKGVLNFCFTNETTLKSITDNDNILVSIGSVPTKCIIKSVMCKHI
jgi:hypothetical protein